MPNQKPRPSHPLDILFAAPSHIAVLRALRAWSEGLKGRELARVAGLNHEACRQAVARLLDAGLVNDSKTAGPRRIGLNVENGLIRTALLPLLAAESKLTQEADARRRKAFLARAKTIMGKAS